MNRNKRLIARPDTVMEKSCPVCCFFEVPILLESIRRKKDVILDARFLFFMHTLKCEQFCSLLQYVLKFGVYNLVFEVAVVVFFTGVKSFLGRFLFHNILDLKGN